MKGGDLAVATAAVRDDHATKCYTPVEYPAIASYELTQAIVTASKKTELTGNLHVGIFHTKDSLYAREFKQGAMADDNEHYMNTLKRAGAIASEMEDSMIFTLCNIADSHREDRSLISKDRILAGAICAVLGEEDDFGDSDMVKKMTNSMIELGLQAYAELYKSGL
jgi:uridine phosphorylase